MKVLETNEQLFKFRKKIIGFLYEARVILNQELPRIKVRVVDFNGEKSASIKGAKVIGRCYINKNYIVISSELSSWDDNDVRSIVWHELCHAYFNASHDEKCPLMRSVFVKASKNELTKALLKFKNNQKVKELGLMEYP